MKIDVYEQKIDLKLKNKKSTDITTLIKEWVNCGYSVHEIGALCAASVMSCGLDNDFLDECNPDGEWASKIEVEYSLTEKQFNPKSEYATLTTAAKVFINNTIFDIKEEEEEGIEDMHIDCLYWNKLPFTKEDDLIKQLEEIGIILGSSEKEIEFTPGEFQLETFFKTDLALMRKVYKSLKK